MKLLLDTHVWLWLIGNPSKLPRAYADAIANAEQPIALSVASLWEVGIKQRQGKLAIDVPFDELLERGLSSVEVLDIRLPHVLRTNELPMLHRDPFDRMLIAPGPRRRAHAADRRPCHPGVRRPHPAFVTL